MPDSFDSSESNRRLAIVATGAGVLASTTLAARSSTNRNDLVDALADSALGQFVVVAIVGMLAGRAVRRRSDAFRHHEAQILIGAVTLGLIWSLVIGRRPFDPSRLGLVGPPGSSAILIAALSLGVLAWAFGTQTARFAPLRRLAGPLGLGVLGSAGILSVVISGLDSSLGLVSGAVAACLVPIVRLESTDEQSTPRLATSHIIGAAIGLVVAAPGAFDVIARRYPDRVSVVDGAVRLVGPIMPGLLWTVLLAAAVGIGATAIAVTVDEVRTRSYEFSLASFILSLVAVTFVARVATLTNIATARRDAGDPFFYHLTANLLAQGRGFDEPVRWVAFGASEPSALHGPAFPVALSFWSRLGATSYLDHQWASVVLGIPQVVFGVLLARLLGGTRAALLAAALLLVYPNIWITDGSLFVEGLMAGFTMAATWLIYRWRERPSLVTVGAVGALIGFAALTRGEAVLLVVLLVPLVFVWGDLERRQRFIHAGVGAGVCILVLLPWTVYNATRFEVPVALSTNSNEVLYYANCQDSYYGRLIGYWSFDCQLRHRAEFGDPPGDQAEQSVYWRELAVDFAKENRSQIPKVLVARVGRQWELFRPLQMIDIGAFVEGRPKVPLQIGLGMYYAMMGLSVAGSIVLRRRRLPIWPLWCHAVAVTLTAIYAYGTLRFRAPFEPILCVMAAVSIAAFWDSRTNRPDAAPFRRGIEELS